VAEIIYRRATSVDLPAIIDLLADDILGAGRESAGNGVSPQYTSAFAQIEADPNQLLVVADDEGAVIGTLQLSFIPGLSRGGSMRGQIEAVRVAKERRSEHIGEAMFTWAIETCQERGCTLVQLTTDKARPDAHRFYDRLGFQPTHIGYKLYI